MSATSFYLRGGVGVVGPRTDLLGGAGSFASATGWSLGAGWSIAGGQLIGVPNVAQASALWALTLEAGTYEFVFDVKAITAGSVSARVTGGTQGLLSSNAITAVGDNQVSTLTTTGSTNAGLIKNITFNGTIDNLRVYRT